MGQLLHLLKAAVLGVLLFLQFYFLYSGDFDHLLYDDTGVWLGFLLIMITIPVNIGMLLYIIFRKNETLQVAAWIIAALSIITNGPFFGYWSGIHEARCYAKNGVKTRGVVNYAFYSKGERMYYNFRIKDKWYTSFNVLTHLNI